MTKVEEPKLYKGLRVAGFIILALALVAITIGILAVTEVIYEIDPEVTPAFFVPGGFAIMISIFLIIAGYEPRFEVIHAQKERYIQQETKADLKVMADTKADIANDAIEKTARAFKDGLSKDETEESMFCKHCGKTIDQDSTFCKHCGKQQ